MRRRIQGRLPLDQRSFLLKHYSEEAENEKEEEGYWIDGGEREERGGKDRCNDCIGVKALVSKEMGGNDAVEGLRETRSDHPCWEVQIKRYTL